MERGGILFTRGRASVTDLGRVAGPSVGLPVGGAMDQFSARLANARVGNAETAALLELTILDTSFIAERPIVFAVAGASCTVRLDGVEVGGQTAYAIPAGVEVSVSEIRHGVRAYAAVAGGLDAPSFMGSCAPDATLGAGVHATPGVRVGMRGSWTGERGMLVRVAPGLDARPRGSVARIRVLPGPEFDDYGGAGSALFDHEYTMGKDSNHIGLRFEGTTPVRASAGELLSRGVAIGAVEIPSPGHVIVLHRGRGTTAGYPVQSVVAGADLDVLAQLAPGAVVRFALADPEDLRRERLRREGFLADVRGRTRACLVAG